MHSVVKIGMKIVLVVIDCKLIFCTVDRKLRIRRTVCNSSDSCSEEASVIKVILSFVVAEDDILVFAFIVCHYKINKTSPKAGHCSLTTFAVFDRKEHDVLTRSCLSEL